LIRLAAPLFLCHRPVPNDFKVEIGEIGSFSQSLNDGLPFHGPLTREKVLVIDAVVIMKVGHDEAFTIPVQKIEIVPDVGVTRIKTEAQIFRRIKLQEMIEKEPAGAGFKVLDGDSDPVLSGHREQPIDQPL